MVGNGTRVAHKARRAPEQALRIIQLFDQEEADPRAIAKTVKLDDHRAIGRFMHRHGYVWCSETMNYVPEDGNPDEDNGNNTDRDEPTPQPESGSKVTQPTPNGPDTDDFAAKHTDILDFLAANKEQLLDLLANNLGNRVGAIPRYTVPGTLITKSVHMPDELAMLASTFSKEKNISQREIFEIALIEFFRKYGYLREVSRLLEGA